ncbi:MAG TPA: hypothetical protein VE441_00080 [Mycobacterium sp.]|nr:hypothetical protein [Mycobacterium sp.]
MSHDYHEKLPGYHAAQLLHDGCRECEQRAKADDHGIANLDVERFERAWHRAVAWQAGGEVGDLSYAEVPMLSALWAVQIQFQRRGVPLGQLPTAVGA